MVIWQGRLVVQRELLYYVDKDDRPTGETEETASESPEGSQVVRLPGEPFRRLLAKKPELATRMRAEVASRRKVNAFVEGRKDNFRGVADMYSSVSGGIARERLSPSATSRSYSAR